MFQISEWLANPVGKDAEGEWIEFVNGGDAAVSLAGNRIQVANGKAYAFKSGTLAPGQYLILRRSASGLTLRNSDEHLKLYSPAGKVIQEAVFRGTMPEGKSVAINGKAIVLAEPSPGAANANFFEIFDPPHFPGEVLGASLAPLSAAGLILGVALGLTAIALYIVKSSNDLQNLFFPRDAKIGGETSGEISGSTALTASQKPQEASPSNSPFG